VNHTHLLPDIPTKSRKDHLTQISRLVEREREREEGVRGGRESERGREGERKREREGERASERERERERETEKQREGGGSE
jgi:hypothetical protein